MKVLFIGGTGIISSACSQLAIDRGIDLYHINRGSSSEKRPIDRVKNFQVDIRDVDAVKAILEGHEFGAVVDFISFVPEHIESNFEIFKENCKQYVFISSASAYQTPPDSLPVTEETPLDNPFWEYSRNKIQCELKLKSLQRRYGFKYTIIRPSHTYDKTLVPFEGGYNVLHRLMNNKEIVVHGDGTSLWTLTHHSDFAKGLIGLLGSGLAINQAFHITSDEYLSWNSILKEMAKVLEVDAKIVHIPSDFIKKYDDAMGDSLLGDKAHSMIFDNSKVKNLVFDFKCTTPFKEGIKEVIEWYKANPKYQIVDQELEFKFDKMIRDYKKSLYVCKNCKISS